MTYLILDLAILILLAVAAFLGYRRGLILTLCSFLAVFAAFIGATAVSNAMAGPMSRTIQPALESSIQHLLDEKLRPAADDILDRFADSSDPEEETHADVPLQKALDVLKESPFYRGFADTFQESLNAGMVAATANAARVVADYIALQIARTLLFFLSFALILILWALASHVLDLAFKLPVLSTVNQWLGAGVGLLRGIALTFILCWLLRGTLLSREVIQNSILLRFFCTVNPLSLLS